jgi:hypothetical protein
MFGSVILDVAIGLVLVYLLLSLLASAVREALEGWLRMRATNLERGIKELLDADDGLVEAVYSHPHVAGLYRGTYEEARKKKQLPTYIPSSNFALAVLDIAARGRDTGAARDAGPDAPVLSLAMVRQNVARLENPRIQRLVLSAVDTASGDLATAQRSIEHWFDSGMDRVSGWYKRQTGWILVAIGLVLAVVMNVDSVRLAQTFYHDPAQRQAAVAMAGTITKESSAGNPAVSDSTILARLDSLQLPIGWSTERLWGVGPEQWWLRFGGWLFTAIAVSLGAPFWFDLLSRIMVVRSTVKPHEKSPEEASQDRQVKEKPVVPLPAPAAAASRTTVVVPANAAPTAPPVFTPHEWSSGRADGGIL